MSKTSLSSNFKGNWPIIIIPIFCGAMIAATHFLGTETNSDGVRVVDYKILGWTSAVLVFIGGWFCLREGIPKIVDNETKPKPFSFSFFQLWLWTLIIAPIFCFHWVHVGGTDNPMINNTAIILLGISVATAASSSGIAAVQKATEDDFKSKAALDSKGFIIDILRDDEGKFSIGRLQNLIFTLIYVTIYATTFILDQKKLPDFDNEAFVLMGVSSSAYLLGKGAHK